MSRIIHMCNSIFLLFLLIFLSVSCNRNSTQKTKFIEKTGTYTLFEKKLKIDIYDKNGMIEYEFSRIDGVQVSLKPSRPRINPSEKWFIYPVAHNEVWIYEGNSSLVLYKKADSLKGRDSNSYTFIEADASHNILAKAPEEVLNRIPLGMKEIYGVK